MSESEDNNDKFQFADFDDSNEMDLEIERNQNIFQVCLGSERLRDDFVWINNNIIKYLQNFIPTEYF